MSGSAVRNVSAELVIGVAVCVGAYAVLIEPVERQLDQAARMNSQVEAERRRLEQGTLEPDVARRLLEQWNTRAERIEQMGRPARDEATLMALVSDLARAHDVRIEQVQPEAATARAGGAAGPNPAGTPGSPPTAAAGGSGGAPASTGAERDARAGLSMTLVGSFENVVTFLNVLEISGGHARVASVRLTPASEPGAGTVTAVVRTEHFAFGVPATQSLSAAGVEEAR
jgi:hypothetical protein